MYLIVDECLMISREFFTILEEHVSAGKGFDKTANGGLPFGGVNVILCGDFHQLTPVACQKMPHFIMLVIQKETQCEDKLEGSFTSNSKQPLFLTNKCMSGILNGWISYVIYVSAK